MLAAEAYGAEPEAALPAALAVEVFHNFTLVHDDIMDHAASRRGRATVHSRWNEPTAILCGDLLLAESYRLLAGAPVATQPAFHRMVRLLCEGQALDKDFETRPEVSIKDYLHMIDRKTAALLQACFELGVLCAGGPAEATAHARELGLQLGRAFQIQDDLLDLTAEDARWGKTIGGDLVEGKRAYLLLLALERTRGAEQAWFRKIIAQGGLDPLDVPEARRRLEQAGVLEETAAVVERHSLLAEAALDRFPRGAASTVIRYIVRKLQSRAH